MPKKLTASDLYDWRARLALTQTRAADALQTDLETYIILEAGCASASKSLLRLAASLEDVR